MNIFVIHSGCDRDIVMKRVVEPLDKLEPRAKLLVLEGGKKHWKREALRLIKQSQMFLFVVGETSNSNPNIGWELERAIRLNKKIFFYKINEEYKLHPRLNGIDRFTKKESPLGDPVHSMDELAELVCQYENGEYEIFNAEDETMNSIELLEQYRLFLETSEHLVERRQSVNNFYLSANTALFSVVAIMFSLMERDASHLLTFVLISFILLSIVGIILCLSWVKLLESYGTLNSSKMKVISIIEKRLPISLFDSEWKVMSDKLNSKRYVSFTDSEKRLPKLFIVLYVLMILLCVIGVILFQ